MRIFICIKQVPDKDAKIKIATDGMGIDTAAIKWMVNPFDEFAIEEAIKIKESHPGSVVTAITLGPKKRVTEVLRVAIAMGADEGIVIDAPETIDPLTTAKALAAAIRQEPGADLILVGNSALDDNASSVGPMLAQILNIPHASVVNKLSLGATSLTAERAAEGGTREVTELNLPALVSVTKGLNTPRFASLPNRMKANKKQLKELDLPALQIEFTPRISLKNYQLPAEKPAAKTLSGATQQQVSELIRLLRDEAKAL